MVSPVSPSVLCTGTPASTEFRGVGPLRAGPGSYRFGQRSSELTHAAEAAAGAAWVIAADSQEPCSPSADGKDRIEHGSAGGAGGVTSQTEPGRKPPQSVRGWDNFFAH